MYNQKFQSFFNRPSADQAAKAHGDGMMGRAFTASKFGRHSNLAQNPRKSPKVSSEPEELRKQKLQVQEYVNQLEKQLPGKADLDGVLSDINQSGMGRGLMFDSFKPGAMVMREHYAEWPISLKVTGKYHDIGSFLADIARLPRIVTLHDMVLTGPGLSTPGQTATPHAAPALMLEATARTYRYVAAGEAAAAKTAASPPGASNAQVSRAVASKAAAKGEKK
jgi:Tfp pilus assembly protein PilO